MPSFNNGKIYKLWSPQGDDIYIGSTTQSLSVRKAEHKRTCNNDFCCSSKILFQKYDDVRIELIEEFPCENKMELNKREGHYIRTLDCINKQIPGRTRKEINERQRNYRENNIEKIIERRQKNKEKENERNRRYHEANKDEINERRRELYENNKEHNKQYYENNKDKINQIRRERYENNREKINQKQRERYAKKKNLECPVLSPEQPPE